MSYAIHQSEELCIINVDTSLDAIGVVELSAPFLAAVDSSPDAIELNLAGVDFLDPSGLGLLVALKKRQRAKRGAFRLTGLKGQPAAFIRNLKLETVFGAEPCDPGQSRKRMTAGATRSVDSSVPQGARVVLAA